MVTGVQTCALPISGDLLTDEAVPVVADSAATLLGTVAGVHDGGDHRIVVIRVTQVRTRDGVVPPLVYWHRAYRRLSADSEV